MAIINESGLYNLVLGSRKPKALFVAKDVCLALGYADPTNAMKQHCRGVVKRHPILDSLGRTQEARVLTEPDVLRLIIGSTLPSAVAFERWVFEEVLPSIRKTGAYLAPGATLDSLSPEIRAQIGGIVKAVVGKQVSEALTVSLPALVSAELARRQVSDMGNPISVTKGGGVSPHPSDAGRHADKVRCQIWICLSIPGKRGI